MNYNDYGYDPFLPYTGTSGSYSTTITAGGSCYNPYLRNGKRYVCAPTTTPMKLSVEELRNYIMNLETTRKIEDLSNVEFDRPVTEMDVLYFDASDGKWKLTNYLSGGEW